jgi:NADPH2:quinone reductase
MAGIVEAVGANVYEFKPGDRVAAYYESFEPHGTFAELFTPFPYCFPRW